MLTTVLGFATALVYGFADFFGAVSAKRINAVFVTFASGVTGFVFLLLLVPVFGAQFDRETILWGIAAGVTSSIAMSCLYISLAIGPISILSPLGAVASAIFPAIVGFALGDRFSWIGWVALALVLVAVVFVGFIPGEAVRLPSARGLFFGLAAGIGIGVVLICLHQAPADSGLGSIVLLRGVAAGILGSVLLLRRFTKRLGLGLPPLGRVAESGLPRRIWLAVAAAGLFDASANLFFILASRVPDSTLTVVGVLTALYPLGTIVLARVFLHERIALIQQVGIGLALAGSALLAIA